MEIIQDRKEYKRNYYISHKEQIKEQRIKYYQEHKEYFKNYYNSNKHKYLRSEISVNTNRNNALARNRSQKTKFLEMYGGKCDCCGESTYEFLCLDHVMGKDRKYKNESGNTAYKRAIEQYDTKEYRILCANCNQATKRGHICPHKINEI